MNKALFFACTMTLISLPNVYSANPAPDPSAPLNPEDCGAVFAGCVEEKRRPLYPDIDSVFGSAEDPAAGGWRCVATLPKPPANDKEAAIADELKESAGWINSHSLAWNPLSTNMIASGGLDGKVRIWSISTGECRVLEFKPTAFELEDEDGSGSLFNLTALSVAWSHDGELIAAGFGSGIIRVWSVRTGELVHVLQANEDGIPSVTFSRDGLLASCSRDQTVHIWNLASEKPILLVGGADEDGSYSHEGGVNTVAWHPTGRFLASGGHDEVVKIWDVTTGECMKILKGHTDSIVGVSWNDVGELVSCGSSGSVFFWDVESGDSKLLKERNESPSYAIDFDQDGRFIAVGFSGKTIRIFDTVSKKCVGAIPHDSVVFSVAWGQDGRLASCGPYGINILA